MTPPSWRRWLTRLARGGRGTPPRVAPRRRTVLPCLEGLEDRVVPAVTFDIYKNGPFTATAGTTFTYQLTIANSGSSAAPPRRRAKISASFSRARLVGRKMVTSLSQNGPVRDQSPSSVPSRIRSAGAPFDCARRPTAATPRNR